MGLNHLIVKRIIISSLFLGCLSNIYGQINALDSVLENTEPATKKLLWINNLDVFSYYNIWDADSLNSDLKKEFYIKSKDYSDKLDSLKKLKSEMFTSKYYIKTGVLEKYDVVNRGFPIQVSESAWDLEHGPKYLIARANTHGNISSNIVDDNDISICLMPIKPQLYYQNGGATNEILLIPMNEITALEVENHESDEIDKSDGKEYNDDDGFSYAMRLYFIFIPSGVQNENFSYNDYGKIRKWNVNYLKADKVRVILTNVGTGIIYYDKTYLSQPHQVSSKVRNPH